MSLRHPRSANTRLGHKTVVDVDVPRQEDDNTLFLRFRERNDEAALKTLILRYTPHLQAYLFSKLENHHAAEDVRQDVFVQILRKGATFDPSQSFKTWIFSIAHHRACDYLRSRGRHSTTLFSEIPVDSSDPDPFEHSIADRENSDPAVSMEQEDNVARLYRLLGHLPALQEDVVRLHFFHGLKYREIAQEKNVSPGAISARIHQAVSRLRELFGVTARGPR